MGRRPEAPGTADQRNTKNPWKFAEGEGWQHGRKPNPPTGLTDAGKKAWRTWLGSWWACFYTPDDLPGLELCVRTYDAALSGHIDVAKAVPLMDRYGITPEGRFKLRWARKADVAPARQGPALVDPSVPSLTERRRDRASRVS